VNSVGGKWEVPTGIFRMQAAAYNNRSNELAWVQPNTTNKDVVVAVLDTGIDAGHPGLVDKVVSVRLNTSVVHVTPFAVHVAHNPTCRLGNRCCNRAVILLLLH